MARCEFAPGSPWNTTFLGVVMCVRSVGCSAYSLLQGRSTAEELARAGEVLRRVDAERHAVDDGRVDAQPGLDRAQLLELLALLQMRGRQRHELRQRGTAIGVEPDVMVERSVAPGRLR